MREPVKVGDICIIMRGMNHPSPNVGKICEVVSFQGEHSLFGRIFRIEGKNLLVNNADGTVRRDTWADVPAAWLMPIRPGEIGDDEKDVTEKEKELEV